MASDDEAADLTAGRWSISPPKSVGMARSADKVVRGE
jgi:hypothetical protein